MVEVLMTFNVIVVIYIIGRLVLDKKEASKETATTPGNFRFSMADLCVVPILLSILGILARSSEGNSDARWIGLTFFAIAALGSWKYLIDLLNHFKVSNQLLRFPMLLLGTISLTFAFVSPWVLILLFVPFFMIVVAALKPRRF